ncbi:MAG: hypothetical protein AB2L20_30070 [Mangrovibacterium sp.]
MNFELTQSQIEALSAKFSQEEIETAISIISEITPEQKSGKYAWDALKKEMQSCGQLPSDDQIGEKLDQIIKKL